jgi:2-oxoisovalerate dehydrogenase E2 component (dihydrolipoyl transacylase)
MAEKEFKLPDVGEGLTEADIVAWHVKPGEAVEDGQIIVEIETAKAVVELPCPWDGTVVRLLAEEGQTVEVGVPIIAVEVGAPESAERAPVPAQAPAESATPAEPPAEEEPERHSVLVGYGVRTASTARRARKTSPAVAAAATRPETAEVPTAPGAPVGPPEVPAEPGVPVARVLAKPPVRKLAKDLGISLAALAGSGPDGSITRDDVQRAAAADTGVRSAESGNGSRTVTPATAAGDEERIPVRGVRKHMAAAMVSSAFTAPHVTEFLQVDVTETMSALRRVRELPEFAELRVSPLLFAARALLTAVARHPLVNSSWDAAAEEIVVKHYVNLGIAVAAERGLIVPNIKRADALGMPELARSLQHQHAAHAGVVDDRHPRRGLVRHLGEVGTLRPVPGEVQRVQVIGGQGGDGLGPDHHPGVLDDHEHLPDAVVHAADQGADREPLRAERHLAGSGSLQAHLVLDVGDDYAVAPVGRHRRPAAGQGGPDLRRQPMSAPRVILRRWKPITRPGLLAGADLTRRGPHRRQVAGS